MPKRKRDNTSSNFDSRSTTRSNIMNSDSTTATQLKKLTCPVCCDKFQTPKILQCGHTFCQQCLQQLFQLKHTCCPVCKAKVANISNNSAATLPTNYALKALVEEDIHPCDKDLISRTFGECPTHSESCDQFCRTCERQLCKQCVSDNHRAPDHETSPVLAVVVQQTEIMKNLARELSDTAERLKGIEEKIMTSERTCEIEANQLSSEINSSVAQSSQIVSVQAESLQTVVEEDKKELLKYLEDLRLEHSELSLSATYAVDLCQSLQMDLDKNNLSRVGVIKRLNYNNRKMKSRLQRLEGKKNVFNLGLRFQSSTKEPKVGKLIKSQSLIPVARLMRTISLSELLGRSCLLRGFVWPVHYWMMAISIEKFEKHYAAEFYNMHFFVAEHFTHEIGIDDIWSYISNSDYSGKYVLCLAAGKIHKFLLPSEQNEQKAGKIVSTVFLPASVNAVSWDEKQEGCYALLKDRKTLLHLEFEGKQGYREVAVMEEEMGTSKGTHALHVNAEGSMAICDQLAHEVLFFEKIGSEPTLKVKSPPGFENADPLCVNTRKEDKRWYVLWRQFSSAEEDLLYDYRLAVYDSSFKLLGCVGNLTVSKRFYPNDRAMICFQGSYLALIAGKEVELHFLQ